MIAPDVMDEPLTEEAVRLAYKLILGRAAENDAVVRFALGYGTIGKLRRAFLSTREFTQWQDLHTRAVAPGAPPLQIETETDEAGALAMLAELRTTWDAAPPREADGDILAADVAAILRRNRLPELAAAEAFELGCGAGRITRHLAPMVRTLTAADAAPRQLAALRSAGLSNLSLRIADDLRFGMIEPFDLFYSYGALHHSPPPLAARALARAFALLRAGGVAIFQAITYGTGYSYAAAAPPPVSPDPYGTRHVLPQPLVFELAARAGGAPVEVFDDLSIAPGALWRSTMFVMRKPAA